MPIVIGNIFEVFPGKSVMIPPFHVHIADTVLDDLRARVRHTRWPDFVEGNGW